MTLGWMGFKLWLRSLPRRPICLVRGHRWGEPDYAGTGGPLDVPPAERSWEFLGAFQQCERCWKIRDVASSPEDEARWLADWQVEAEAEWALFQQLSEVNPDAAPLTMDGVLQAMAALGSRNRHLTNEGK